MKVFYIFFFIIVFLTQSWGQERVKKEITVVKVPDNVRKELFSFLKQKHEVVEDYSWHKIYNLDNKKDYEFKNGAYYFWGDTTPVIIRMFVNYNGKIKIFDPMAIDNILEALVVFNKKENVPKDLQVLYLKGLVKYIEMWDKLAKEHRKGSMQ